MPYLVLHSPCPLHGVRRFNGLSGEHVPAFTGTISEQNNVCIKRTALHWVPLFRKDISREDITSEKKALSKSRIFKGMVFLNRRLNRGSCLSARGRGQITYCHFKSMRRVCP
jgi:hypothetical protein